MKKKNGIVKNVIITLCLIVAIFLGGYFVLDKVVVPNYFGQYGIDTLPDLMGVVTSLYSSPKESKLVTNGYVSADLSNSIKKLQNANYKINDDGTINKEDFDTFKGSGKIELTDKELAAVLNKLLENGMLVDALPNLNYLNTMNIELLQVIATPNTECVSSDGEGYYAGNISFIVKIDTTDIRDQIAEQMQTPSYLLSMIIPDNLYFTVAYDFDLYKSEDSRTNGTIAINGRTAEQSELLINLLISFIFPEEDEMNLEKFTKSIGDVALLGIDALGEFKFSDNIDGESKNGFIIYS